MKSIQLFAFENSNSQYGLSKISEKIYKETEEKIDPAKATRIAAFNKILELNNELHLSSDGRTWTREELYERN